MPIFRWGDAAYINLRTGEEYVPVTSDWQTLFDARDFDGLDAWYVANTGHTGTPTRTFGEELVDSSWLTSNQDGTHVYQSGGRWIIQDSAASHFRVVANNVTFRNCLVQPGGGYHGIVAPVGEDPTGIIIENCTLNGQNADWIGIQFPEAATANQITVKNCDISSFRIGIQIIGGMHAEENYVHDLFYAPGEPHDTSMSIRARNVTLLRNRLTDGNSSALAFYNETTPYTGILVEENIFSTSQAIYEVTYLGSYPVGSNTVRLVNNLFDRGALAYTAGNFSEISGNVDADGNVVN